MEHHVLIKGECTVLNAIKWNSNGMVIHSTESNETVLRFSIGTFVKIHDKMHLIACYHGIDNHLKITCYKDNYQFSCHHVISFPEYDISLLRLDDDIHIDDYIEFSDLVFPIEMLDPNITIKTIDFKVYKGRIERKTKTLSGRIVGLNFDKGRSYLAPRSIYLDIDIDEIDDIDITGLSGSPVYSDNKFIGIISYSSDSKTISVIHSSTIDRLIKSKTEDKIGFSHLPLKTRCVKLDPSETSFNRGLLIDTSFDLEYLCLIKKRKKKIKLNTGDIITDVDSNSIHEDGYLYDCVLGMDIPLDVYIFLRKYPDDKIDINILRRKQGLYYPENLCLSLMNYHDIIQMPLLSNRYIVYKNIVYTELTEEVISKYYRKGDVEGYAVDLYKNHPYGTSHFVVSIDIIKSGLSEDLNDMYIDNGLPIYTTKDMKYCIPVLSKIDNYKIVSLDKMITVLKKRSKHKLTFDIDDSHRIHITV